MKEAYNYTINKNFYTLIFKRKQAFKRKPSNIQEYYTIYAKDPEEARQKLITKYSKSGIDKDTIQYHLISSKIGHNLIKGLKRPRVPKVQLVRSTNKQRNREIVQKRQGRIKLLIQSRMS